MYDIVESATELFIFTGRAKLGVVCRLRAVWSQLAVFYWFYVCMTPVLSDTDCKFTILYLVFTAYVHTRTHTYILGACLGVVIIYRM